jgi:hypothetical protein
VTAGWPAVCCAMAGPDKGTEFLLLREYLITTARWLSPTATNICANGPAIWGGCVTRRKHRPRPVNFSQKTVTVPGGYGALFAIQVQVM